MITTKLLLATAAALTLGVAGPALAQSAGSSVTGADGDHSNTSVATTQVAVALNSTRNTLSNETTNLTRNSSENVSFSNSSQRNGNVHLVADQSLDQTVSNRAPINMTGRGSSYSNAGNTVGGSAFAAYSGILNQGWNTGINSNAAGATNIAAQGSTTFTTR